MIPDVNKVYASELKIGHPKNDIFLSIVPNADHNETAWGNEFAKAMLWLFAPQ